MKRILTAAWLGMAVGIAMAGPSNGLFRVTADRVNLRARPSGEAEVVGQVQAESLVDVRCVDGEWACIAAPTNLSVWVSAAFVRKGVVTADRVLMRAGPGSTFRDIGALARGETLDVLETRGEWLRCRAPAEAAVWVSMALLAPAASAQSSVAPTAAETRTVTVELPPVAANTNGPGTAVLPAGLMREELALVIGQGAVVERQGLVDRVPLAFLHCASYRLVSEEDGRPTTVCYLRGNETQMPSLVGRRLAVRGRLYWLKAEKAPLLYPDEIKPLSEAEKAP